MSERRKTILAAMNPTQLEVETLRADLDRAESRRQWWEDRAREMKADLDRANREIEERNKTVEWLRSQLPDKAVDEIRTLHAGAYGECRCGWCWPDPERKR